MTTAAASVWVVTQPAAGGPTLVRLDPQGQVVARIPLGLDSAGSDIAADAASVWVVGTRAGQHGVVQIDAQSNSVSRWIPNVFGPLAAVGNGVWGTASRAVDELDLVRLDESTGDITARVVGKGSPFEIVPAGSSVWVLPRYGQQVVEVDATTGSIKAEVTIALAGTWAAWDGSRLWLSAWPPSGAEPPSSGGSGSGYIDPNSGLFVPVGSIYNFRPFATADGQIWFIAGPHDGSLHGACALDPTTGHVTACGDITGPELDGQRSFGAYEPTGDSLWIATPGSTIDRVSLSDVTTSFVAAAVCPIVSGGRAVPEGPGVKTAFGHDPIALAFSSLGPMGGGLDVRDDAVGLPCTVVAAPLVHEAARTNATSGKNEHLPICG